MKRNAGLITIYTDPLRIVIKQIYKYIQTEVDN